MGDRDEQNRAVSEARGPDPDRRPVAFAGMKGLASLPLVKA